MISLTAVTAVVTATAVMAVVTATAPGRPKITADRATRRDHAGAALLLLNLARVAHLTAPRCQALYLHRETAVSTGAVEAVPVLAGVQALPASKKPPLMRSN